MSVLTRSATALAPAIALGFAGILGAQSPVEMRAALPSEQGVVDQVVFVESGVRTYFIHRSGDLVMYDHASRTSTRIADRAWDATVSAKRDLVAYVKSGEGRTDH